ncbi:hypothetical protein G6F53_013669 [Rhizopus delemar]|nr:hypothetical protein G6F53_013669 [Rhizopus delemar]
MAHVGRGQGHRAQHGDPARTVAGLFLQLAVGRLLGGLAGVDAALDQAQLVAMHASRVFTYQPHGFLVEHRHHHHRTMTTADQALEAAVLAVGELQVQMLALEGAVFLIGDPMDDRQATAGTVIVHAESPRRPAFAPGPIECAGSNMFMSPKC